MANNHMHFLRLNPVEPRRQKATLDTPGVVAWLFDLPVLLFWVTWILSAVFSRPGPYQAIFSPETAHRGTLYVLNLGFPLAGLCFGLMSLNQRRRRSDLGTVAVPLSLMLLGAGLLYSIVRAYTA